MIKKYYFLFYFCLSIHMVNAQVVLTADGPGNTYELINSVLAPGHDVIETPDCSHTGFGRHIDEVFDSELNKNVFRFVIHKTPDDDRCKNFDRQRNEIKTYDKSPDNLLAVEGETVVYKWKFKLASGFKPSSSFTHIHQIKSIGGPNAGMPMYTLTLRKGSPDRLELRYAETNSQETLKNTDLTPFKGTWVDVIETITYGAQGSYAIEIRNVINNNVLFSYNNNSIVTWQIGASIARPKWGIYRSLNNPSDLRDETVLFSDFSIEEIDPLSLNDIKKKNLNVSVFPNPTKGIISIKNLDKLEYSNIHLYDSVGKQIDLNNRLMQENIDVSGLHSGFYYIIFYQSNSIVKTLKCLIK